MHGRSSGRSDIWPWATTTLASGMTRRSHSASAPMDSHPVVDEEHLAAPLHFVENASRTTSSENSRTDGLHRLAVRWRGLDERDVTQAGEATY